MFADSLLENHWSNHGRRGWTTLASFALQSLGIAVVLMLVQQKLMTPPPADEQQEMQQKMMKWMMVVFGLFFYKVAAGLCIYFIASSLWGFAERKLLPKAKTPKLAVDADSLARDALNPAGRSSDGITTKQAPSGPKAGRNKRKKKEEEAVTGLGQLRQRLSDWWNEVLDKARKK